MICPPQILGSPPPPPGAPRKKIMHIIFFNLLIYKYNILTNLPKVSCGFNSVYSIQIGKYTCKNFDVSGPDKVLLTCISIYVSLYTPLPPPPHTNRSTRRTRSEGGSWFRWQPRYRRTGRQTGMTLVLFISLRNKPWKSQWCFTYMYIHYYAGCAYREGRANMTVCTTKKNKFSWIFY